MDHYEAMLTRGGVREICAFMRSDDILSAVYIYSDTIEAIHLEIGFRAGMRLAAQLAGLSAPEPGL